MTYPTRYRSGTTGARKTSGTQKHPRYSVDPETGRKVLNVFSNGAKEFSPFSCQVEAFDRVDSIEGHYQAFKVFIRYADYVRYQSMGWQPEEMALAPEAQVGRSRWSTLEIKQMSKRHHHGHGHASTDWVWIGFLLPNGMFMPASTTRADDMAVQWYVSLWYKFLAKGQNARSLIKEALEYDDFLDIYKGKFPFSQEVVWRLVKQAGGDFTVLLGYCGEFFELARVYRTGSVQENHLQKHGYKRVSLLRPDYK